MMRFGIIGGSGFYDLENELSVKNVKTPFGKVSLSLTSIADKDVAFIARHGKNHSLPPHQVNYRANIYALYTLGVERIISTSAVGSLEPKIPPGSFVVPHQFIDFTSSRPKTFFDGKFSIKLHSGKILKGVVHTDFSKPYCPDIRAKIIASSHALQLPVHEHGVYVCTDGPRFETPAEIVAFKVLGSTIVGMTSVSEAVLARELGMCYATLCLVTNLAAGFQEKITMNEVFTLFNKKMPVLKRLIETTIAALKPTPDHCVCSRDV